MKKSVKIITSIIMLLAVVAIFAFPFSVKAAEPVEETGIVAEVAASTGLSETSCKAFAAAIAIGLVAATGAIGMAMAISKSAESVARQPEASGKIQTLMMLGLVFVETAIIYALIVAILIIFVL